MCLPQVGNQVEVRQSDGQYKLATILKLTDQTTYTVGECGNEGGRWVFESCQVVTQTIVSTRVG